LALIQIGKLFWTRSLVAQKSNGIQVSRCRGQTHGS
jgi:hypothetical protein